LLALSISRVGCFIGTNCMGVLAYADDIILMAATATAIHKLLAVSGDYTPEYCISFNVTIWLCFLTAVIIYANLLLNALFLSIISPLSLLNHLSTSAK
jgi:hypothetical protein